MAPNGTLLAGGASVLRGSLYLPTGGQFYLKITDGDMPDTTPPAAGAAPQSMVSWHLQVVEVGKKTPDQNLTVYTPFFLPPDAAVLPPPVTPKLTDDQTHSALMVKGDNAEGSGFLVKTPDGTFVMTTLHLLANNPNIKILTSTGTPITPISLKGATDCDIALFAIKDNNYKYFSLATDIADTVEKGDKAVIPGITEANGEVFSMPAKVTKITPDTLAISANRLVPASSGAPLVHAETGRSYWRGHAHEKAGSFR